MTEIYSPIDKEIIALAAVWDLIGSMVNYANFDKFENTEEVVLRFKNQECGQLFLIFLTDFLSNANRNAFRLKKVETSQSLKDTYLGNLLYVAENPEFKGPTKLLISSVKEFSQWLGKEITSPKVWFPSIEREGDISVQRLTYLKICGNASKHGFTRLNMVASDIRSVLQENGTKINEGDSYRLIRDFVEQFNDHGFLAINTSIAFFLNEIRWGIYYYLRTEFERAFIPGQRGDHIYSHYSFDVPSQIVNPLVRSLYLELMNKIMRPPTFPRFTAWRYVKDSTRA